ncbi:MAG: hypothetical protein KatS3mg008_0057 [Acidimicrobiales bacterium]|nr:MAG: hypothetical protein KatS3mg008_0057 [Acidimicrobiales bacterium]
MNADHPPKASLELALVAVSGSAAAGFARVFGDLWPVAVVVVCAVTTQLLAGAGRRYAVPFPLAVAVPLVVWIASMGALYSPSTLAYGLPTPATIDALWTAVVASARPFGELSAPVPPLPGFVVTAGLAVVVATTLSDWAIGRLGLVPEALVPHVSVFAFSTMVGADRHRTLLAAAFVASAVFLVAVTRTRLRARPIGGADAASALGRRLAFGALLVGTCSVALATTVVVAMPDLARHPKIDLRGVGPGEKMRVTVSPMVDIRHRLVEQSELEVFTVRAAAPAYWRLTALEIFDGRIWKSRGDFEPVKGDLDGAPRRGARSVMLDQTFEIAALAALWLPAAFEPVRFESGREIAVFDPESATLIVDETLPSSDGLTYRVRSAIPVADPSLLSRGRSDRESGPGAEFTALPADFPARIRRVAEDVVAGAESDYGKALALQNWLRNTFVYDTGTPPGHGNDAILDFLQRRRGYCEQFAGTFAAMARAVGLPARVAVGFTPGERDATDPNLWHVRGRHAHAWPEVYLPGAGWLPFEPTPGRGAPLAERWTGVRPMPIETAAPPAPQPAPTTVPVSPTPSTIPALPRDAVDAAPDAAAGRGGRSILLLLPLAVASAVAVAWVWWRRGMEFLDAVRARTPRQKVEVQWRRAVRAFYGRESAPAPSMTPVECARAICREEPTLTEAAEDLAASVNRARYSATPPSGDEIEQARLQADRIVSAARSRRRRSAHTRDGHDSRGSIDRRPDGVRGLRLLD